MITCLADVLTPQELTEIRQALQPAAFADGRATAGWHARLVKHNLQVRPDPAVDALRERIGQALRRHPVFELAVRPRHLQPVLLSRYEPGMACPGCQHRAFHIGRQSAECARCGTALPLAPGRD